MSALGRDSASASSEEVASLPPSCFGESNSPNHLFPAFTSHVRPFNGRRHIAVRLPHRRLDILLRRLLHLSPGHPRRHQPCPILRAAFGGPALGSAPNRWDSTPAWRSDSLGLGPGSFDGCVGCPDVGGFLPPSPFIARWPSFGGTSPAPGASNSWGSASTAVRACWPWNCRRCRAQTSRRGGLRRASEAFVFSFIAVRGIEVERRRLVGVRSRRLHALVEPAVKRAPVENLVARIRGP